MVCVAPPYSEPESALVENCNNALPAYIGHCSLAQTSGRAIASPGDIGGGNDPHFSTLLTTCLANRRRSTPEETKATMGAIHCRLSLLHTENKNALRHCSSRKRWLSFCGKPG